MLVTLCVLLFLNCLHFTSSCSAASFPLLDISALPLLDCGCTFLHRRVIRDCSRFGSAGKTNEQCIGERLVYLKIHRASCQGNHSQTVHQLDNVTLIAYLNQEGNIKSLAHCYAIFFCSWDVEIYIRGDHHQTQPDDLICGNYASVIHGSLQYL